MSIQQNFPAITPSLSLNFARAKTLDPRITFTRTSSATRVNGQGLIEVVPANAPRFDHSYDPVSGTVRSLGLLIEESRTNLVPYSEDFSQWTLPSYITITPNNIVSPDGTQNADLVSTTANESGPYVGLNPVPQNTTYTLSVFLKYGNTPTIRLRDFDGGTNPGHHVIFNLLTQTFNSALNLDNYGYIPYPNGWYRVWMTFTTGSYSNISFQVRSASEVTGDETFYVYGAQVEVGAFPTSYIPTSGSTVTRTADNASITGTNFSDFYNQDEGSYRVQGIINASLPANTFGGIFGAGGGNETSNFIFYNPGTSFGMYVSNTGQSPASGLVKTYTVGSPFKISASYATNDFDCSLNGDISSSTLSNALYKSHTYFRIGGNPIIGITGGVQGTMSISNITYYSKKITNSQLQNLTK